MATQQVLVLIKPDGMVKSLVGNILSILSETKLKIVGAKIVRVKKELAEKHYERHKGKPFYDELMNYLTGNLQYHTNRILAIVYEGDDAIEKIRTLVGNKNPENADPKSIRGKFGRINSKTGVFENVLHASDEASEAEREIKLWFKPSELANVIFKTKEVPVQKTEMDWA